MTAHPTRSRPHDIYRREFLQRILEEDLASLLDIGCGDGALLTAVTEAGVTRVAGIEPGPKGPAAQALGFPVQEAHAEALPFADDSFDVVTFQYVVHHVERMREGLHEALRVARHAVLILDGWYDERIASQRVARDFDEWAKAIDRGAGLIHNSCPQPDELAGICRDTGVTRIDYACRLVLSPLQLDEVEVGARALMKETNAPPEAAVELERILAAARLHGMSDDGALFFRARLQG